MTPQQLIDLPGYGQANKRVKAMGMWRETMTDTERLDWIEEYGATVIQDVGNETFTVTPTRGEFWDILRTSIDNAATKETASNYEGYK